MLVTEDNYGALVEHFSRSKDLVADLETTGLKPFNGHRLCGIALESEGVAAYFAYRHGSGVNLPLEKLGPVIDVMTSGVEITGHNWCRFDAQTLAQERQDVADKMIWSDFVPMRDTILDAYLFNENSPSFKLEALADEHQMVPGDPKAAEAELLAILASRGHKKKDAKGHLWELAPEEVEPYACNDVVQTRGLKTFFGTMLNVHGLTDIAHEFVRYARIAARMERVGLKIDLPRLEKNRQHTQALADKWEAEIMEAAPAGINLQSPKQVCAWLGIESSAADVLAKLSEPRAQTLSKFRKAKKALSTYHEAILRFADEDAILHPQYNLTRDNRDKGGTASGRLSCSEPNFQALPDVEKDVDNIYCIKECVIPRAPDRVFLAYDLERAEVWVGGSLCGEPAIHRAYFDGIDVYVIMAEELGIDRKAAKTLFLGLSYGMGVKLLAERLGISNEDALALRNKFHGLYPSIKAKMWELSNEGEQCGYVELWTGRRIHCDGKRTKGFHMWNRCVQGGVAEILRLAMCKAEGELEKLDAEQVLQIHDELVVECPTRAAAEVNLVVRACLETPHGFSLPPRTAPQYGFNLGELQEGLP
jgi:DNA polymerase I-like protein with 3'-5' exonuclease and polymerase domains